MQTQPNVLLEFRDKQQQYLDSYLSHHVPRVGDTVELGQKRPRKDYVVSRVEWLRPTEDGAQHVDITVKEE